MKHVAAVLAVGLLTVLSACASEEDGDVSSGDDELTSDEGDGEGEELAMTSDALKQGGCSNRQIRYAIVQCKANVCKNAKGIHWCRPNNTNGINASCACR